MIELVVPVVVALVLVVIAWKLLKGVVKTVALIGIAALAVLYLAQSGGLG